LKNGNEYLEDAFDFNRECVDGRLVLEHGRNTALQTLKFVEERGARANAHVLIAYARDGDGDVIAGIVHVEMYVSM